MQNIGGIMRLARRHSNQQSKPIYEDTFAGNFAYAFSSTFVSLIILFALSFDSKSEMLSAATFIILTVAFVGGFFIGRPFFKMVGAILKLIFH